MTDYSSVKNELMLVLNCDEEQADEYGVIINNAIACVQDILKDSEYENDTRIVHLCAVKAYYRISLLRDADSQGVKSFKAGDVSYTADTSSAEVAKRLLEDALADCSRLIKRENFTFRVV